MSDTSRAFPTIERIAATPLNETFHYQGYQLYSEARALWLIYQDTLSALTAAKAKLAEVEAELSKQRGIANHESSVVLNLKWHLERVEAERDALKEDAERYRWLKEMSRETMLERSELEIPCADGGSFVATFEQTHDLDAALDAARKK